MVTKRKNSNRSTHSMQNDNGQLRILCHSGHMIDVKIKKKKKQTKLSKIEQN